MHDTRSFGGLASFYRKFICGFLQLTKPLTDLTRCNACAARPRTCLVLLPSSPRVLLHVDARATIPDQETDRVCTSGYITGKKGQRQLRTTHKCTIMKCTILLIKHNHSITPTFTVMNPLLRLSYGQCSSIPNPLLRPSPSQCGSPPSSNSPSTNPNQI